MGGDEEYCDGARPLYGQYENNSLVEAETAILQWEDKMSTKFEISCILQETR